MEKDCQQCLELLPWYVNGTLSAAQAQQVFEHIARCPHCAEQERFLSELQQQVRAQHVAAPAPDWSELQRRLEKQTPKEVAWWRRGVMPAAALIAIVAIFVVRLPSPSSQQPAYRLMTSSAPAAHVARDAAVMRVLLADGGDHQAAKQLFSSIHGEIIAGPTPRGVYTVAIKNTIPDRDALIASLRANNMVEFAEWIETP